MRILPVVLCAVAFGAAWAQCEEITGFESRVEIERGGDVRVTETIAVVAGGEKIKRGIYRDFPTLYRSVLGLRRSVDFEVTGVLRDGVPEPWHSEGRANGVRIYIGEAGRLIDHGPHTYTLSYRTNRQLVLHDDFDEFYWNVTGNGWDFPIARAKVKITLPPGAPLRSAEAYTGPGGARGTAWRVVTEAGADVVIETTAPLAPGEGLTVSVTWPKGYVDADANPRDLAAVAGDNPFTAASLAALVLVLAYYMIAWVVIGRDPPRGVIIPRYAPPEGFTPSAVRFLAGLGRVDDKSFAAAVLQLAVSGALRIRQNKEFTLERTDKAPALPKGQRAFLDALLGSRNISSAMRVSGSGACFCPLSRLSWPCSRRGNLELPPSWRSGFPFGRWGLSGCCLRCFRCCEAGAFWRRCRWLCFRCPFWRGGSSGHGCCCRRRRFWWWRCLRPVRHSTCFFTTF